MNRDRLIANTLIYDRHCDLCRWTQRIISKWDRSGCIHYLGFQDPLFHEWFPAVDPNEPPKAMLFIDRNQKVWEGSEAARRMLYCLPGGAPLSVLMLLPGAPWVANKIYEWIAKNRYRFQ